MALEPELLALMTEAVTIELWTGQSTTGTPAYAAPVSYPARIELKSEALRLADGRQVIARGRAYLAIGDVAAVPTIAARVTMPTGYLPLNPPILDVQTELDEASLHHVVLILG